MSDLETMVKDSYNACWASYKEYLGDHDMAAYNKRSEKMVEEYAHAEFVVNNLFLFVPLVNALHEEHLRMKDK